MKTIREILQAGHYVLPNSMVEMLEARERERDAELEALRLVHMEARELIGEVDDTGVIPIENISALRSLLWRASLRKTRLDR